MKRLFFSQSMLDSMVEAGKIRVEKDLLTMLAGDQPVFRLIPAYRFVKTLDNSPDSAGFAGQIRSERELRELGAEVYMDSVIYRETAYQADPGFIAEKDVPAEQPAEQTPQPAQPPADASQDANDLSKFILDNLL